ncbi:MAG: 3'-5' exonuclease [Bacteroidia bacterium]
MPSVKLENILFLDIETVAKYPSYEELPARWKELWAKKASYISREVQDPSEIYDRAAIYAEFGKIICISVAFLTPSSDKYQLRVKSFYGHDENSILNDFCELLEKNFYGEDHYLCAHNGKEFDFPYLGRRMLANKIALPNLLRLAGKKPWEVRHLDTMQLWKFGDFKSYTSLELLAAVFDIPTPKDDLDGSKIYHTYYKEKNLERIRNYCQKDVVTLANLYLRINNFDEVLEEQVIIVE